MLDARAPQRSEIGLGEGGDAGTLLLTGATGLVGMQILARYLQRTERRVCALVRADGWEQAAERVEATLTTLFGRRHGYSERVLGVPADIEAAALGLEAQDRDRLAAAVSEVIHCAASVSFSLPLERSREINVDGTRRMLELAELCRRRGGLRRFSYVSTAYVAGTHDGEFNEDQLDVGQGFRNPYERSKFEAEQLVRSYRGRLPIQVFRPSIIVGERATRMDGLLQRALRAAQGVRPGRLRRAARAPLGAGRRRPGRLRRRRGVRARQPPRRRSRGHLSPGRRTARQHGRSPARSLGELLPAPSATADPARRLQAFAPSPARADEPRQASPCAAAQRGLLPLLRDQGPLRQSSRPPAPRTRRDRHHPDRALLRPARQLRRQDTLGSARRTASAEARRGSRLEVAYSPGSRLRAARRVGRRLLVPREMDAGSACDIHRGAVSPREGKR